MMSNRAITPIDGQPGTRFGTVLVCRTNTQRPSDLEIHLRSCCKKLKVVEKLNGAHFVIQEAKMAIRVYHPEDVRRLDEALRQSQPKNEEEAFERLLAQCHGEEQEDELDVDGLRAFRKSFQNTRVLCVLPEEGSMGHFERPDSFINKLQQIMNGDAQHNSRVVFVHSSQSTFEVLTAMVDCLKDSESKRMYYSKKQLELFIPNKEGVFPDSSSATTRAEFVFRDWARQNNLPEGEESILMTYLKSLGAIVTADDEKLLGIPIEEQSKIALHQFFGSKGRVHTMPGPSVGGVPPFVTATSHNAFRPLPSPHPIISLRPSTIHQPPPQAPPQARPMGNVFRALQARPSYPTERNMVRGAGITDPFQGMRGISSQREPVFHGNINVTEPVGGAFFHAYEQDRPLMRPEGRVPPGHFGFEGMGGGHGYSKNPPHFTEDGMAQGQFEGNNVGYGAQNQGLFRHHGRPADPFHRMTATESQNMNGNQSNGQSWPCRRPQSSMFYEPTGRFQTGYNNENQCPISGDSFGAGHALVPGLNNHTQWQSHYGDRQQELNRQATSYHPKEAFRHQPQQQQMFDSIRQQQMPPPAGQQQQQQQQQQPNFQGYQRQQFDAWPRGQQSQPHQSRFSQPELHQMNAKGVRRF